MKKIGIILTIWDKDLYAVKEELIKYLDNYKVEKIGIFLNKEIRKNLKKIDGIIIPGGTDRKKEYYELVKYAYINNIPTLGICNGMQIMAETFDNQEEDKTKIKSHYKKTKYAHEIKIKKSSKLYEIIKQEKILVNSRHKYQVDKTTLDISAISKDDCIEAVEDKNKKFFIGVQWHPESLEDDVNTQKIFDKFIESL